MTPTMKTAVFVLVAGLFAGLLAGCQTIPPRGSSSGRISTDVTTDAERRDARPLLVAYMEFSDQVSQQLAQDLVNLDLIKPGGDRSTVILGDIMNKTSGLVSTQEFEMVRSRIRNNLLQSKHARGHIKWVENRARMEAIAGRERVGNHVQPAGPPNYDPNNTFALNGDMYRLNRGPVNQYYMEFMLVNFATNELVFTKRYEIKQAQ